MEHTNERSVNPDSINFAAFMIEGLQSVDAFTPTIINKGGCGVFAAMLYDELKKCNVESEIVLLYPKHEEKGHELLENTVKWLNGETIKKLPHGGWPVGCMHAVVRVGALCYDCDGVFNIMHCYETNIVSREDLQKLDDNPDAWNDVFDRDCIPDMQRRLDAVFQHISDYNPGMFEFPKPKQIKLTKKTISELRENKFNEMLFKLTSR